MYQLTQSEVWESVDHHKAFISNKAAFKRFLSVLQRSIEGPATLLYHVHFSVDPRPHLQAAPVELAYLTLEKGSFKDDLARMKLYLSSSRPEGVWGQAEENEEMFVLLRGSHLLAKVPVRHKLFECLSGAHLRARLLDRWTQKQDMGMMTLSKLKNLG